MKIKKITEKDFKKWIEEQVRYYKPFLGLELQRIVAEKNNEVNCLQIELTYPYLDPTIEFSDKCLQSFREGKIPKDRILHELCHAITDPLYYKSTERFVSKNEIEDEREKLTDIMTVIIRNLLK